MNVSYLSNYDTLDIQNWSGLDYYIAKALEKQKADLSYVFTANTNVSKTLRYRSSLYKLIGKNFDYKRTPKYAKAISDYAAAKITARTQVVFSPSSLPLALLNTNKPKVFYTDATFAGMLGFYDDFSNFCSESIKNGNQLEQQALEASTLAIYASDWAAKTAIKTYNISPEKVKVVPFGANVEHNLSYTNIREIVESRSKKECNLLFLGVEWKRKGADMAVRVAEHLNKLGVSTKLHLVGVKKIPVDNLPDCVINYGFISKSNDSGKNKIKELLALSHFLIVPSKAEAYGLVYCEANSFGVPAIATNVGGIPTIIKNDINGKTFSVLDTEQSYAEYILDVFTDQNRYRELAYSSFNEYINRLNWNVAGKTISDLLKEVV